MEVKRSSQRTGRLLLTGILSVIFLYVTDPVKLVEQISQTDPLLYFLSLCIFLTVYPLTGLRWKIMNSNLVVISFWDSMKTLGISYGLNKILPLNSGDIVRSKILENYVEIEKHGEILGLVGLERFIDVSALITFLSLPLLFFFSNNIGIMNWIWLPILATTSGFYMIYFQSNLVKSLIMKLPDLNISLDFKKILVDAVNGFNSLNKLQYGEIIVITFLRWIFDILSLYVLAMSVGHPLSFWTAALLTCAMSLVSSMPITPSGAGAAELSGTAILVSLGFSTSVAGTIVILQRSFGVGAMGIIGIVLIKSEGINIGDFRNL